MRMNPAGSGNLFRITEFSISFGNSSARGTRIPHCLEFAFTDVGGSNIVRTAIIAV